MYKLFAFQRKKCYLIFLIFTFLFLLLGFRLCMLTLSSSRTLTKKARDVEQRERPIKAARGIIYDRRGVVLADNKPVSTISVVYHQVKEPGKVIRLLSQVLSLPEEEVRKKVEKVSSREKILSNVPKEKADRIRKAGLAGIKVDEDYRRSYPHAELASRVLGFTGADNQGILGLESRYEEVLRGKDGKLLTMTDFMGIEIENEAEERVEPEAGGNLYLTLDYNMQCYAQQAAEKVLKQKNAKSVSVILMNPQNGEIFSMVHVPEYDLNQPYTLIDHFLSEDPAASPQGADGKNQQLNKMWRNPLISDSYEPGSTFKIVTATAALSEGKVSVDDTFFCPGFRIVEDRKIRCHKTGGHGSQTFKEGVMNSCNPVFMDIGARVGAKDMLKWYHKLGLYDKTGVDLPGEAGSIMHPLSEIGPVELATMSFGQSIQITPLQLLRAVSAVVNGGKLVTPHLALFKENPSIGKREVYKWEQKESGLSVEVSATMKDLLTAVVAEGTGHKAAVPGWQVGGKTATSQKLPRSSHKYISSFLGFAPSDNPKIMGLILIDEPEGIYYGGTIAAPVMAEIFENVLPCLDNI